MHSYEIFQTFKNHHNEAIAIQMAAYMKNKFPFLGIKSPDRRLLAKPFLKEKSKSKMIDWDFIVECFTMEEREYQYLALDYLILMKKYYQKEDID
ncbi:MAG: DNA alkylation repair protein, partial [Bacteroidota bacterium]